MTKTRICVWSGPRNISTALMYSFANRTDTRVIDEPFYAHYLNSTGVTHPGREEVLASQEIDAGKVIDQVVLKDYDEPILFIKNMAHHLTEMRTDFLDKLINVFLIRDPEEVITSLIKNLPEPVMRDTGFKMEYEIFESLQAKGLKPLVIDAHELLKDPEKILKAFCQKVDISFEWQMLSWNKGPRPEDGVWAKYWYENVHNSTGFAPYCPKNRLVPPALNGLLESCQHYYDLLYREAIKA
ncbi:MAG: sulfotransferase family protein [Cytophagales bacterium]|nr:sulfotransferase family protein [Cytophagales bacterium]